MNKVMTSRQKEQIIIDTKRFAEMPMPLQRRGIKLILNYLYKEKPGSLSAVHIDQVFSLLRHPQPSGRLDFPNGLKVLRSYQECHFQFNLLQPESYYFEVAAPGTFELPGCGMLKVEYVETPAAHPSPNLALFRADRVHFPLIVRTRKAGDRMSLKGMLGTKKLKDIFIDKKISIRKRETWPVVTDQKDDILWLPGLKKSAVEGAVNSARCYIQLTYIEE